jgi:membrane-bound metal-dependent hydrolase YbcI (DUF457 family)
MNGKSHLVVNFAAAIVLSSVVSHTHAYHISGDALSWQHLFVPEKRNIAALTSPSVLQKTLFYVFMLLGAWLPDLDHKRSFISQRFPWISAIIRRSFSHRTFTHSLLGVITLVLFFGCFGFVVNLFLAARGVIISTALQQGYLSNLVIVALGCLCHMVADMLTPMGIPWFWPAPGRYSIPIIRGEFQEFVLVCALLFLVGVGVGFHVLTF